MATTRIKTRIRHKIDTEANWELNNPTLSVGEIGFVSDGKYKNFFKLGDGKTPWLGLQYAYSEFMASLLKVDEFTLEMTENGIAIKDTGVVAGEYSADYDSKKEIFTIPSFKVNSSGQLTEVSEKRVTVRNTMSVVNVSGTEKKIESNYALYAGKSTATADCIINVPSMATGSQVVIKNVSPEYSLIVRTAKNITIDGFNGDIILAPYEYITIISISTYAWSIISESSRFDTSKLSALSLNSDVVVRQNGNKEQSIATMNINTDNVAIL